MGASNSIQNQREKVPIQTPTLSSTDKLLVLGTRSECRKTLAEAKLESTCKPNAKQTEIGQNRNILKRAD